MTIVVRFVRCEGSTLSDDAMILLVFGMIAFLGGGTVVRLRRGSIDRPATAYVRYEVDGKTFACRETVKLRSEPIKPVPYPRASARPARLPRAWAAGCAWPTCRATRRR